MDKKIPVVAVVGPTASGKTELGIALAKALDGEIVSADSMQVYRGIHIASAAPDADEMQGIRHHLLEFLDVDDEFSVCDYVNLASEIISDINKRGKLPIVVGGTGLYVNSLLENIDFGEQQSDKELRRQLEEEYDTLGGDAMLERVRAADEEYGARLHANDKKRIVRALEIISAGETVSERLIKSKAEPSPYDVLYIGVNFRDRQKLYDRINRRVDIMLGNGLLEEAKASFEAELKTASQAIGHKELFSFFEGEQSLDEAVENLKMQTRRYAKRQLTWFGRNEKTVWLYKDEEDVISKAMEIAVNFLKSREE